MPKINLSEMNIEALMDLRERVDGLLSERRAELEQQLERMGVIGGRRVVRGGRSAIGVRQAKLGQAVAQDLVGLLLRSKVERSWRIS